MPKGKFWTKEEIDFLKNNYQNFSCRELSKQMDRSESAIGTKVIEIGLKKIDYNWSDEQLEYLKNNYESKSYAEIGKKINRSRNAVQCKMRTIGLVKPEKYFYDVDFFEKIDSEDKAYWLGFIYADGYIHRTNTNSELGIMLSKKDKEHLKKFNKSIVGNVVVEDRIRDTSNSDFIKCDTTVSSCIRLYRKKIVEDLVKYGINENKTYNNNYIPKQIPKNLIYHFIRGYFDGDGNVWCDDKKNKQLRYTIYGASKTMLEDIKKELYENNIFSQIIEDKRDMYLKTVPCYRLIVGGIKNSYNFYNYLYNNSNLFLDRKYIYATNKIDKHNIKEKILKHHK